MPPLDDDSTAAHGGSSAAPQSLHTVKAMGSTGDLDECWFLTDRAVEDPALDAFHHHDIARQLSAMVQTLEAPATIGLIGEFGTGKSSIGKFLAGELKSHRGYQVVSLSAEKHSGEIARQRALVYSFAEALIDDAGIDRAPVERVLRRVDFDEDREGPDLGDLPIGRFLQENRDRVWMALKAALTVFAVAVVLGMLVAATARILGADNINPFTWPFTTGWAGLVAAVPVVTAVGVVGTAWLQAAVTPGRLRRSQPRAESADEFERVFGDLAQLVKKKLVILVDDIDRLPAEDVLEALRTIKTFQSVPKNHPPIFVIACDETIVEKAILSSDTIPSSDGDRRAAVHAYLNKLFTARQPVPPLLKDDMQSFAERALAQAGHAGVAALGERLRPSLQILLHDGVTDPRHVIRLLNAFFTDYRLARVREAQQGRLGTGEVTSAPELLARLTVLRVDFSNVYRAILQDFELLAALDSKAAGDELGASAGEALEHLAAADRENPALMDFLRRTAPYAPANDRPLAPFFYLGQTPAGRVLGSRRAEEIRRSISSRDVDALRKHLTDVDTSDAGLAHAIAVLRDSPRGIPQQTAVHTACAVLPDLDPKQAAQLAHEVAVTVLAHPDAVPAPGELVKLIQAADDSHQGGLINLLLKFESGEEETDMSVAREERAIAVLELAKSQPTNASLQAALSSYFTALPKESTWGSAGEAWVTRVEELDPAVRREVIDAAFYASICRLSVGSTNIPVEVRDRFEAILDGASERAVKSASELSEAVVYGMRAEGREPRWFAIAALRHLEVEPADLEPLVSAALAAAADAEVGLYSEGIVEILELVPSWLESDPGVLGRLPDEVTEHLDAAIARTETDNDDAQIAAAAALASASESRGPSLSRAVAHVLERIAERREANDAHVKRLRTHVIEALPHLADADADAAVAALVEPIRADTLPEAAGVPFGLDSIPPIAATPKGRSRLQEPAASWWKAITNTAEPLHLRTPIAGLAALMRVDAMADDVAQNALARLQTLPQYGGVPQQVAALGAAAIPWKDAAQREAAANIIVTAWPQLPTAMRDDVVRSLSEWSSDDLHLGDQIASLLSQHLADPDADGALVHRIDRLWPALGAERPAVAAHFVNASNFVRSVIAEMTADELAATLAAASAGGGTGPVAAAASAAPPAVRNQGVETFIRNAANEKAGKWQRDSVRSAVELLDGSDVAESLEEFALELLGQGHGKARRGAVLLDAVYSHVGSQFTQRSGDLAAVVNELLPDAPVELATDLGMAARSVPKSQFESTRKSMLKTGDQQSKEAAEAFKDAHGGR